MNLKMIFNTQFIINNPLQYDVSNLRMYHDTALPNCKQQKQNKKKSLLCHLLNLHHQRMYHS